jgi:hypothetical protein
MLPYMSGGGSPGPVWTKQAGCVTISVSNQYTRDTSAAPISQIFPNPMTGHMRNNEAESAISFFIATLDILLTRGSAGTEMPEVRVEYTPTIPTPRLHTPRFARDFSPATLIVKRIVEFGRVN